MKLRHMMKVVLALSSLASCREKGPAVGYERLGAHEQSLRTAFNADVGKARVVMLVSPT
jgi:hypothetical protein